MLKVNTQKQKKHIEMLIAGDHPDNLISFRHGSYTDPDQESIDEFDFDGRISFDTLAEIIDYIRACDSAEK